MERDFSTPQACLWCKEGKIAENGWKFCNNCWDFFENFIDSNICLIKFYDYSHYKYYWTTLKYLFENPEKVKKS